MGKEKQIIDGKALVTLKSYSSVSIQGILEVEVIHSDFFAIEYLNYSLDTNVAYSNDNGQLSIESSSAGNVSISGNSNVIVQNGSVVVNSGNVVVNSGTVNSLKKERPKLRLYYVNLEEIYCSGAVAVSSSSVLSAKTLDIKMAGVSFLFLNLDVSELLSDISGDSKFSCKGKALLHNLRISGAASFKGTELKTEIAKIKASGASKVQFYAVNSKKIRVSGAARVKNFKN